MPFGWTLDLPKRDTGEYETTHTTINVTDRGSFRNEYRHEISISAPTGSVYIELGEEEVNKLAYALAKNYLSVDQLDSLIRRYEQLAAQHEKLYPMK